jgi:hypothetical protein
MVKFNRIVVGFQKNVHILYPFELINTTDEVNL